MALVLESSKKEDTLYAVPAPPGVRPWALALTTPAALVVPWCFGCRAIGVEGFLGTAAGMLLLLVVAAATITDLKWCRIFNWTTYSAVAWALLFSAAGAWAPACWSKRLGGSDGWLKEVLGFPDFGEVVAGFAVCLLLMVVLFSILRGGAGDIKLVAAIGAVVGWERGLEAWICACILAAGVAACILVWRVGPLSLMQQSLLYFSFPGLAKTQIGVSALLQRRMPMAPFIAAGALLAALRLV